MIFYSRLRFFRACHLDWSARMKPSFNPSKMPYLNTSQALRLPHSLQMSPAWLTPTIRSSSMKHRTQSTWDIIYWCFVGSAQWWARGYILSTAKKGYMTQLTQLVRLFKFSHNPNYGLYQHCKVNHIPRKRLMPSLTSSRKRIASSHGGRFFFTVGLFVPTAPSKQKFQKIGVNLKGYVFSTFFLH